MKKVTNGVKTIKRKLEKSAAIPRKEPSLTDTKAMEIQRLMHTTHEDMSVGRSAGYPTELTEQELVKNIVEKCMEILSLKQNRESVDLQLEELRLCRRQLYQLT